MNYALVKSPTFYRGKLWHEGDVIPAFDAKFGTSTEPCDAEGMPLKKVKASVAMGAYGIQSAGGGRWVVTNPQGERCSEIFQPDKTDPAKAKASAQAQADSLNAGEPQEQTPVADPEEGTHLPDA